MVEDFARGYAFGRVATSTTNNYEASWRMWVSWRMYAGKGIWLEEEMGKVGMVKEVAQYMAFCCAVENNKEATVAGKLVAVNFYHEQWLELPLSISHVSVKAVRQGIKRAHVESGSQQGVRRPLTWGMLAEMEGGSYE